MTNEKTLAGKLKKLRDAAGINQAQLAKTIGKARSTVQRLERGSGNPTLRTMERLAKALGTTVVGLLS